MPVPWLSVDWPKNSHAGDVQNIALLSHDFSRKPLRIEVRVDVTTKKMI